MIIIHNNNSNLMQSNLYLLKLRFVSLRGKEELWKDTCCICKLWDYLEFCFKLSLLHTR